MYAKLLNFHLKQQKPKQTRGKTCIMNLHPHRVKPKLFTYRATMTTYMGFVLDESRCFPIKIMAHATSLQRKLHPYHNPTVPLSRTYPTLTTTIPDSTRPYHISFLITLRSPRQPIPYHAPNSAHCDFTTTAPQPHCTLKEVMRVVW